MSDTRRDSGLGTRDSGNVTPVELDAAIDAVAREMTDAEPSGTLRARVLEQIEDGRRRSSFAVPRWTWAGASAVLTLAVATAVWFAGRPLEQSREAVHVVASGPAVRPAASPAARPEGEPAGAGPEAAVRVKRAATARMIQADVDEAAEDSHHVPALAEIEPLRFAAVGPDPLQIAAVEVPAFPDMTSIDVPSLEAGSSDTTTADPKKEKSP